MAGVKIGWRRVGPERPASVEVPTLSMRLNGYVLDWDARRERVVYACGPGYDGFGELWSFDGTAWVRDQKKLVRLEGEGPYAGYYDVSRGGVVAHHFGYDYERETHRPLSLLVTPDKATILRTKGELPQIGEDVGSFDPRGAFAYDAARDVGVCLTPAGVWELDAAGVWAKRATVEKPLVPSEWKDACGGGFDPVRSRCFLWVFDGDDYVHRFYDWDGTTLRALPTKGLPTEALHMGLFNPSALVAGHAKHGIALYAGPTEGMFAFDGSAWKRVAAAGASAPPRMTEAVMCHDRKRDLVVIGPGYHEGDAGGREAQRVFFVGRASGWERQGVVSEDSPLAKLYYKRRYFVVDGVPHAAVSRHSLSTLAWRDGAWQEVVGKESEAALPKDQPAAYVSLGDRAIAVTQKGAVFSFDGRAWTKTKERVPDWGERTDPVIASVPSDPPAVVVWGGAVKNRASNDTFVRRDGTWRKAKKPSPRPKDFAHGSKDDIYVDYSAVWDTTLARVVRFGYEEVWTLEEGDVWRAHVPAGYEKLLGSRNDEHFPAHDDETGETLLVNLREGRIVRFDLAKCEEVARLVLPEELAPKEQHDMAAWARIHEDLFYDPTTRTLNAQFVEDRWARYAWDLGPAFEAASRAKPRVRLASDAAPATGRAEKKKVPAQAKAPSKAPAKAPAKGRAKKRPDVASLSMEALAALVGVESRAITVGKKPAKPLADHAIDRLGGLPSGVSAKDWPKKRKKPMGFLLQLATDGVLSKHAGIAVFCTTDGTATEDDGENAVLLLSKKARAKAPLAAPPGDVPVLGPRPIRLGPPRFELIEAKAQELADGDAEASAAIDRLAASRLVHEDVPYSKLGGEPVFVQGGDISKRVKLVAQIDFDGLSLEGAWKDAGLFGVLYVFATADEKKAFAMWQYT